MSTDKPIIPSGYVLYARAFIDLLADAPLLDRVLWTWLLCKANHKDRPGHPNTIRRGQLLTTIDQMRQTMRTRRGYTLITQSADQIRKSLRRLCESRMIATQKTRRGLIITICDYDAYQNSANYEGAHESHTKVGTKVEQSPNHIQECNNKNDKKGNGPPVGSFKSFYELDCDRASDSFELAREEFLSDGNVKS